MLPGGWQCDASEGNEMDGYGGGTAVVGIGYCWFHVRAVWLKTVCLQHSKNYDEFWGGGL